MLKELTHWWKERRGYDIPEKIQPVDEDGKIKVKSTLGKGSTFTCILKNQYYGTT